MQQLPPKVASVHRRIVELQLFHARGLSYHACLHSIWTLLCTRLGDMLEGAQLRTIKDRTLCRAKLRLEIHGSLQWSTSHLFNVN